MGLTVVSGVVATLLDIGQDETWLRDWLRERPARLGLGELHTVERPTVGEGTAAFLADDESRVFSVSVHFGELDAADAFSVLEGWADSRDYAPEKEHVAVIVTERLPDRYRGTLGALADRLSLVVVGLSVWRGESEAIVVPHVALASQALDLASAPAAAAASAIATAQAEPAGVAATAEEAVAGAESGEIEEAATAAAANDGASTDAGKAADEDGTASVKTTEQETDEDGDPLSLPGGHDTGVSDPWGLGRSDSESGVHNGSYAAVGSR
jgi:hypothetical protein